MSVLLTDISSHVSTDHMVLHTFKQLNGYGGDPRYGPSMCFSCLKWIRGLTGTSIFKVLEMLHLFEIQTKHKFRPPNLSQPEKPFSVINFRTSKNTYIYAFGLLNIFTINTK